MKRAGRGLLVAFALAALLLGVAFAWVSRSAWSPEQRAPRPSSCPQGPHAVDLTLPWPGGSTGQFEFPLSVNGCLRLREQQVLGRRRRWQVLELQPDGGERVLLEADFTWGGDQAGAALVLQQPYAPEPMPTEWRERGFSRLAWFDGDHGSLVRTFEASRREVSEERTTPSGVERRTVTLPPFNAERNPQAPREKHPDY